MRLRRGWIWSLAGLLLAIIAGGGAIYALQQAVPAAKPAAPATRPIIVARQDLAVRTIVLPESIEARDVPLTDIPSGAIFRLDDAAGKMLMQPATAGQPLLVQNLASVSASGGITTTASLANLLPDNKVGVVLPTDDLLGKSGQVNTGDHIDILASLTLVGATEGHGGQVTLMTLPNVPTIQLLQEVAQAANTQPAQAGKTTEIIIAVAPQHAVPFTYFI